MLGADRGKAGLDFVEFRFFRVYLQLLFLRIESDLFQGASFDLRLLG